MPECVRQRLGQDPREPSGFTCDLGKALFSPKCTGLAARGSDEMQQNDQGFPHTPESSKMS